MRKTSILAFAAIVAAGACGKKDSKSPPGAASSGTAATAGSAATPPPAAPITGPSITPTVTSSITFVTPREPTTWVEMSFPCYRAAVELQAGSKASSAFFQASPLVEPALRAADIDLERDVAAIGGWDCGGGPCLYAAVTLRHPEKIADMVKTIPNVTPKEVAPGHFAFDAAGASGPRSIHIRVVPLQWTAKAPTDPWSAEMAKATHVIFLGGVLGKGKDVDPFAVMADAAAAPARVRDAEGVLGDARERCVVGTVGAHDFQPGYKLDRARFALAVPTGAGDPLSRLLDSKRSLDAEVELTLSPAPSEADVNRWIAAARAWVGQMAEPIRMQFAGSGPLADAYLDMMALVGTRGFTHQRKDKALVLSWRTDRVREADISALEHELEGAMGGAP
jgi:hypothetical protein